MRNPIGKPWVVISDFRESQDIQLCRQGEFDRSAFLADVFGPLLPGNHVWVRRLKSANYIWLVSFVSGFFQLIKLDAKQRYIQSPSQPH